MNNSQIDALDFFKNRRFITKISNTETIQSVKKNIFISYQGIITPEIMALGDSKKYITSMKKSVNVVYVYNLIDELTKYIFDNINTFIDINNTSNIIDSLFDSLKGAYSDLTQDHLVLVIKYILYKNVGFQDFKRDIENFEKTVCDARTRILSQKIQNNIKFKKGDGMGIFNIDNKGDYIYSLINCIISIKFESSIDLSKILKSVTVSDKIPVMGVDKVGIKILKGFPKNISEEWVFTKTKSGELKPKLLKGLTLKVKSDNFINDDYYYTVIISDNSKSLVARLNWKKNDYVTFEDVKNCVNDGLSEVVNKINKVDTSLNIQKFDYSKISYSVIQVNTTRNFNLNKISQALDDFGNIFKKQENSGRFLRLIYDETSENITIVIKKSEYIVDGIEYKNNVVEFLNVTPFTHLQKIIDYVGTLLLKSETKRLLEFQNSKLVEIKQDKDEGKKVKETLGTKVLKEAGAGINSVSCQKKRQPTLYNEEEPVDTYILDYKGKKYACKNKEKGYIYPGFTSQKSPCCFTKDQRSKEIYKNLTMVTDKTEDLIITTDSYIISKTRVINNLKGVILSNRIGVLPDTVAYVFGSRDNLFKLGIAHDNFTLLNVFNRATAKNIKPEKINSFTKKYNEIVYTKMNSLKILECLEFYFKINAVVIDNENETFLCNKITGLLYSETIFIIKRQNYSYELLVEKINSEKLKKTFQKDDIIFKNFLINYNKSCIIKYSNGNSVVPYSVPEFLSKGYNITGQIINAFDKIIYVVSPELGIIPVIPYQRLPRTPIKNISKSILTFTEQYNKLKNSGINYLKVKGVSKNADNLVDGIVTASNIIIPVIPSNGNSISKDLLVLFYGYYGLDVDNSLAQNLGPVTNDFYSIKNLETFYYKELYYRLKYTCSVLFSENINIRKTFEMLDSSKSQFLSLLLKPHVIFYREPVIISNKVKSNIRNVCSNISIENCTQDTFCGTDNLKTKCLLKMTEPLFKSFIKRLVIEMKWNKDILSGNVKKEITGKNNFPVRKNEIVLVSPQDFEKFFNKL